ncbi:hypothetical protein [Microseira wollei]|uniref:hypothetical protein n=1 Tax=Microseira wollei TaxID=467598 RepID=UPI001CFCEC24|nr:hypothetical protein [Microseira wollei]
MPQNPAHQYLTDTADCLGQVQHKEDGEDGEEISSSSRVFLISLFSLVFLVCLSFPHVPHGAAIRYTLFLVG